MLTHPKNLEVPVAMIGEKGVARVGGTDLNKIEHWEFAGERDSDKQIQSANYEVKSSYEFGHVRYCKNVVDVLRGEAEPDADGRKGLKLLEVLIAAYISARDGRTISLPLEY